MALSRISPEASAKRLLLAIYGIDISDLGLRLRSAIGVRWLSEVEASLNYLELLYQFKKV